jgi:hypothetical protein
MRPSSTFATLVTFAAILGAPAAVAHADDSAQATITQLQQQGYTVNIDRVGNGRMQDCVVTSVRNPQTQTDFVRQYYGRRDENGDRKYRIVEVVTAKTISVSLDCT